MTYAITRSLDAETGNPSVSTATGAWVRAPSPALVMVLLALRTQLGACPVDAGLGVDWRRIDKLRTTASADAESAIRAGLARLVAAGTITRLAVTVRVFAGVGRVEYEVSFVDARLSTPRSVRGTRSV